MRLEDFDELCLRQPAATLSVQWGEHHVYKVGGKVFALADAATTDGYVFKTSEISFEILTESGVAVRAPYLPRGGWLRLNSRDALPDADLEVYVAQSHRLVAEGLSKAERRRLGLLA